MTRVTLALVIVTFAGCSFPATKMEPVNPTQATTAQNAPVKKTGATR